MRGWVQVGCRPHPKCQIRMREQVVHVAQRKGRMLPDCWRPNTIPYGVTSYLLLRVRMMLQSFQSTYFVTPLIT